MDATQLLHDIAANRLHAGDNIVIQTECTQYRYHVDACPGSSGLHSIDVSMHESLDECSDRCRYYAMESPEFLILNKSRDSYELFVHELYSARRDATKILHDARVRPIEVQTPRMTCNHVRRNSPICFDNLIQSSIRSNSLAEEASVKTSNQSADTSQTEILNEDMFEQIKSTAADFKLYNEF